MNFKKVSFNFVFCFIITKSFFQILVTTICNTLYMLSPDKVQNSCDPIAMELEHGELVCFGNRLHDVCVLACNEGYRTNGPEFVRCQRRPEGSFEWSGKIETCVQKQSEFKKK